MKNNLENSIKESLKGFEAPYNPNAWASLSAKLDATPSIGGAKGSFKWIAVASAILVASFSAYYLTKNNTHKKAIIQVADSKINNNTAEQTIEIKKKTSSKTWMKENSKNIAESSILNEDNSNDVENYSLPNGNIEKLFEDNSGGLPNQTDRISSITHSEEHPQNENKTAANDEKIADSPNTSIILPKLNAICVNEVFTVENTNDIAIIIYGPHFSKTIQPHSSTTLQVKIDGRYIIATNNVSESQSTTFDVKPLPKIDFIVDTDNKFKNGLPTTSISSSNGIDLTWEINGITSYGSNVDAHFYSEGIQTIKLTSIGTNGCKNSLKKEIFNEKKYNLLAVNSFIPNHSDPRLNTFMPFALTERNVSFSLIIIDPFDGHVLYQTNDYTRGWDATDSKTGQQVKYESTYIWKVYLSNPEKGENSEYAGSIIPITK